MNDMDKYAQELESAEIKKCEKTFDDEIRFLKDASLCASELLPVIESFDGKVFNRRLKEAMQDPVQENFRVDLSFSYNEQNLYMGLSLVDKCIRRFCIAFVCSEVFTLTDTGKRRIVYEGFKNAIMNKAKEANKKIQMLEENKLKIKEIRSEMQAISASLRAFIAKHDPEVLRYTGCNYTLKPACHDYYSGVDYSFFEV